MTEDIGNSNQGHWIGQVADPCNHLGFVYLIWDKTSGRKYCGKKQFWLAKPGVTGCKGKTTDKGSTHWKSKCWKESDWRTYKGSSNSFNKWMTDNPDNKYEYIILRQCQTKSQLHYGEVEALVERGALWRKLGKTEEYEYFNRQIPATRFRVPRYKEVK